MGIFRQRPPIFIGGSQPYAPKVELLATVWQGASTIAGVGSFTTNATHTPAGAATIAGVGSVAVDATPTTQSGVVLPSGWTLQRLDTFGHNGSIVNAVRARTLYYEADVFDRDSDGRVTIPNTVINNQQQTFQHFEDPTWAWADSSDHLIVQARGQGDGSIKSGQLAAKLDFGRSFIVEAKIACPATLGTWLAFWTYGRDGTHDSSENDVELVKSTNGTSFDDHSLSINNHGDADTPTGDDSHFVQNGSSSEYRNAGFDNTAPHYYTIWYDDTGAGQVRRYIDGVQIYHTRFKWNGSLGGTGFGPNPELIFDLSVGGDFPGIIATPSAYSGNANLYSIGIYTPGAAGRAVPPTQAWDFNHKGSTITLSGSDLVATATTTGTDLPVYGLDSVVDGNYYWEVVLNGGANMGAGVGSYATPSADGDYIGNALSNYGWYPSGGVTQNASTVATWQSFSASGGVRLCFALRMDPTNSIWKLWGRVGTSGNWNNDVIGNQNPATGTGGLDLYIVTRVNVVPAANLKASADFATLYPTAASWSGTAPVGFGPINDPAVIQFTDTAKISGVGNVIAPAATIVDTQARDTIAGVGAVIAPATHTPAGIATIAGIGSLTTDSVHTPVGQDTIAGVGTVATVATIIDTQARDTISGVGAVIAPALHTPSGVATIAGVGSVTSAATHIPAGADTITGVGNVISPAATIFDTQARDTIAGVGLLTTDSVHTPVGTAAIAGVGTASTTATEIELATTVIAGAGTVAVSFTGAQSGASTIAGVGSLTTDTSHTPAGADTIAGVGTLAVDSSHTPAGSSALAGVGTVTTAALATEQATAILAGVGASTLDTSHTPAGAAVLAGVGTISATATESELVVATIAGVGSVAAAATEIELATAVLTGNGSVIVDSQVAGKQTANAALTGVGAVSAAALELAQATTTITGVGTVGVAEVVSLVALATMAGQGSFAATGLLIDTQATNTIVGVGTAATAGSHTPTGAATIAGAGTVSTAAVELEVATATLAGVGTVHVDAMQAGTQQASAALLGVGQANATAILQMVGIVQPISGVGTVALDAIHFTSATATINGAGFVAPIASSHASFGICALSGVGSLNVGNTTIVAAANAELDGVGTLYLQLETSGIIIVPPELFDEGPAHARGNEAGAAGRRAEAGAGARRSAGVAMPRD